MSGDPRPIGIFDSGVGGLTVLREIIRHLPDESVVYFGDTARVPYGPKSATTVRRYSREAARYLISRDIKLLVIACNTATARAGATLAAELDIPVVGVIEPGARAAAAATVNERIGVIGTVGTIASGKYDLAVRRRLEDARVYAQPCPLFVPLVEEGWSEHPVAHTIAAEYLGPLKEVDIDVLILGCTHYPVLRSVLADVMGPTVKLVDSAHETALDVQTLITAQGMARPSGEPPSYTFISSDRPSRFREIGSRIIGDVVGKVEQFNLDDLPSIEAGAGHPAAPSHS